MTNRIGKATMTLTTFLSTRLYSLLDVSTRLGWGCGCG